MFSWDKSYAHLQEFDVGKQLEVGYLAMIEKIIVT